MAWSRVQQVGVFNTALASSSTESFTTGVTAGHLIIVGFELAVNASSVTVKDNLGNSLSLAASGTFSTGPFPCYIYYEIAPAGVTSITITPSSASGVAGWWMDEWSGNASSSPLDKTNSNTDGGTPGTAASTGSTGTLANASELVVAYFGSDNGCSAGTSGWTVANDPSNSGSLYESLVVSATTAQNAAATQSSSGHWIGLIATFLPAAGGSVSPSVSGTVSVTGSVSPIFSPFNQPVSGNITVTGTANPQLAFEPTLSGSVSVTGVVSPTLSGGGSPVTPAVSGIVSVSGQVSPTFPVQVSPISGAISISGQVNPVFSPINIPLSGLIGLSGFVYPIFQTPPLPPVPPPGPTGVPSSVGLTGRFDNVISNILYNNNQTIVIEASTGRLYPLRQIYHTIMQNPQTNANAYNVSLRFSLVEYRPYSGTISSINALGQRTLLYTVVRNS